jgi:hypothetical protein
MPTRGRCAACRSGRAARPALAGGLIVEKEPVEGGTQRVAISNSRLLALDERGVTFRYKDYRRTGRERFYTITLAPDELISRFLLHVLPKGFHRIRHYGLLASATCKTNIARAPKN